MRKLTRYGLIESLTAVTIAMVSVRLALLYASASELQPVTWRERDNVLWWHVHQLFQREPEELNEWQLALAKDWGRCLRLFTKCHRSGLAALSDNECQFVVNVLGEILPLVKRREPYEQIRSAFILRLTSSEESGP